MRRRLDVELVRRGLVPSREQACAEILAGRVRVGGATAVKAARMVAADEALILTGPGARFVSRGGEKLDAAMERFGVSALGRAALDAGASTGGFTHCLLARGVGSVMAVDVGYGQLDAALRADPRVQVLERTNVRHLDLAVLASEGLDGRGFELIVVDLSFISLRTVAGALLALAEPRAELVVLVKPQFEAGRAAVTRGRGVISDPELWARALSDVAAHFAQAGCQAVDAMVSPLLGASGNVEFFLHLRAPTTPGSGSDSTADAVDRAVTEGVLLRGSREAARRHRG